MMKIGGISFEPVPMTFNAICSFEEMGAAPSTWGKIDLSLLRAYLAVCLGCDKDEAGGLIESHITGGGNLIELREAFAKALEESDFWQALRKKGEENKEE
jgi:hypothetical protein